jgi:hypothetical protein
LLQAQLQLLLHAVSAKPCSRYHGEMFRRSSLLRRVSGAGTTGQLHNGTTKMMIATLSLNDYGVSAM